MRVSEEGMTDKAVCDELGVSTRQFRRWRDELALFSKETLAAIRDLCLRRKTYHVTVRQIRMLSTLRWTVIGCALIRAGTFNLLPCCTAKVTSPGLPISLEQENPDLGHLIQPLPGS